MCACSLTHGRFPNSVCNVARRHDCCLLQRADEHQTPNAGGAGFHICTWEADTFSLCRDFWKKHFLYTNFCFQKKLKPLRLPRAKMAGCPRSNLSHFSQKLYQIKVCGRGLLHRSQDQTCLGLGFGGIRICMSISGSNNLQIESVEIIVTRFVWFHVKWIGLEDQTYFISHNDDLETRIFKIAC